MKSQEGSILIIAASFTALVMVLAFIIFSYVMNTKKDSETAAVDTDFTAMVSQVNSFLQREDSCRLVLGGPSTPGPGGTPQAPQSISLSPNSTTSVNLYYPGSYPGSAGFQGAFIGTPQDSNSFPRLSNKQVQIKVLTATASNGTLILGNVIVSATKPAGLLGSSQLSNSNLNLSLHISTTNQIDSCTAITFAVNGSTGAPIPIPVCGLGQALFSDGTSVKCIQVACPPGQLATPTGNFWHSNNGAHGIGDIDCASWATPSFPADYGPCSTTCGIGTQTPVPKCLQDDGTPMAPSYCANYPPPPPIACSSTSGCQWSPAYGPCSTTCGTGFETPTNTCIRPDGTAVDNSFCASYTPPPTIMCTDMSGCPPPTTTTLP